MRWRRSRQRCVSWLPTQPERGSERPGRSRAPVMPTPPVQSSGPRRGRSRGAAQAALSSAWALASLAHLRPQGGDRRWPRWSPDAGGAPRPRTGGCGARRRPTSDGRRRRALRPACPQARPRPPWAGRPAPDTGERRGEGDDAPTAPILPDALLTRHPRLAAGWSCEMVGVTGFEPATPASRTQCSSQAELHPVQMPADVRLGGVTQALPKGKMAPARATNRCGAMLQPTEVDARFPRRLQGEPRWYAACDCAARVRRPQRRQGGGGQR